MRKIKAKVTDYKDSGTLTLTITNGCNGAVVQWVYSPCVIVNGKGKEGQEAVVKTKIDRRPCDVENIVREFCKDYKVFSDESVGQ